MLKKVFYMMLSVLAVSFSQVIFKQEGGQTRLSPRLLNYQGYLTDSQGNPVSTASLSMSFAIFDAASGGNEKWSETQGVEVIKGILNVQLGIITPLPDSVFTHGTDRWLELTVSGQILSPRTRITSAGYAYTSTYSDTAEFSRNAMADQDWTRGSPDSVLFTFHQLGLARGGTNNALYGTKAYTHTNLGSYACTTGVNGQDQDYLTICGGMGNKIDSVASSIVGGYGNYARGPYSFIGGGEGNEARGSHAVVGGGYCNLTRGTRAVIAGGDYNDVRGEYSAILGGYQNYLSGDYSYLFGINSSLLQDSTFRVDMPHIVFSCDGWDGYEFPATEGSYGQVMVNDGNNKLVWSNGSSLCNWTAADSILSTRMKWGISRGNASNALYGVTKFGHTNLGSYACTTGVSGTNQSDVTICGGSLNHADSSNSAIVGGRNNRALGFCTFVGGGYGNYAGKTYACVTGGYADSAFGQGSHVGGGYGNITNNDYSTICGGFRNKLPTAYYSYIGGGGANTIYGNYSTIGGGNDNYIRGNYSAIGGGRACTTGTALQYYNYCTVAGGYANTASDIYSTVGGGLSNIAEYPYSGVFSGYNNQASETLAVVAGGRENAANGKFSFIGGGYSNSTDSNYSTVCGGINNQAAGIYSFVGGGGSNEADTNYAIVCGGNNNTASGYISFAGGGMNNEVSGIYAALICGIGSKATATYATVITGAYQLAAGDYALALGGGSGDTLTANAYNSLAFGDHVYVNSNHYAVLFDSATSGHLQINRDHHDGTPTGYPIRVGTNTGNGNGAYLTAGGVWSNGSSRYKKEDFHALNGTEILEKINDLAVMTWKFKGSEERHISPVAEDFYKAFGCGTGNVEDDSAYVAALDVAGVSLVAIKELKNSLDKLTQTVENLQKENLLLKQKIERLENDESR